VSESGHVPAAAILVTAAAVWLLTVSGTFVHLATIAVIARMLIYASTCVALPVLRRRDGRAPLHVRGATIMAMLAVVVCATVLTTVTGTALRDVSILLALGLALRAAMRYRQRSRAHRASER
jgi:amino acid transporter